VHCESSALRDIFEFYGFKFSEAMIFGLGSGLGFIYWHDKNMPYPFVGVDRETSAKIYVMILESLLG